LKITEKERETMGRLFLIQISLAAIALGVFFFTLKLGNIDPAVAALITLVVVILVFTRIDATVAGAVLAANIPPLAYVVLARPNLAAIAFTVVTAIAAGVAIATAGVKLKTSKVAIACACVTQFSVILTPMLREIMR